MRPWTVPGRKMPPPACRQPIDILPNLMLMLKFFIKLHKNNSEKQQIFFLFSLFSNIENFYENKTVRKTHLKCIKFELMNFRGRGDGNKLTSGCCWKRIWRSWPRETSYELRWNELREKSVIWWIIQKSISNSLQWRSRKRTECICRRKLRREKDNWMDSTWQQHGSPTRSI